MRLLEGSLCCVIIFFYLSRFLDGKLEGWRCTDDTHLVLLYNST